MSYKIIKKNIFIKKVTTKQKGYKFASQLVTCLYMLTLAGRVTTFYIRNLLTNDRTELKNTEIYKERFTEIF